LTNAQVGVLLSFDAWEGNTTSNLRTAFLRLGLFKAHAVVAGARRPYAAVFEGASASKPLARAVEVLLSEDPNLPHAEIRGWLGDGGFVASGDVPSALVTNTGDRAAVFVDAGGNVGVGTTAPAEKLHLDPGTAGTTFRIGSYTSLGEEFSSGATVLGDGITLKKGAAGMQIMTTHASYGARALRLSSAEGLTFHAATGAVTAGAAFDNEVFRITNGGRVGVGTKIPSTEMQVVGTVTATRFEGPAASSDTWRPCSDVKLASARTYVTLNIQLDADYTGAGVCGSGFHVCNHQEATLYGILSHCGPGNSLAWLVGGFSNWEPHRRSILSGQDSTQCPVGKYPTWYTTKWGPYYGRVHCAGEGDSYPVSCCKNL
jgi:hypothetical protein